MFSQGCIAIKDSITSGKRMTSKMEYYYNGMNQVIKRTYTDSGMTNVNRWDTIIYNGNGKFDKVIQIDVFNPDTPRQTTQFVYDVNNRIIKIMESGNNQNGPWTKNTDIAYNGNGEIISMIIDPASVTGQIDGFGGNFTNMVWSSGNCTSLTLLGDVDGDLIIDTLELAATYDNKNNRFRLEYPTEATDLFDMSSANNLLSAAFINNEVAGPAGTKVVDFSFTYTAQNEILVATQHPALFEEDSMITLFTYDCSGGIFENLASENQFEIYPNPTSGKISFVSENKLSTIEVVNFIGQTVLSFKTEMKEINLGNLPNGLYFVKFTEKDSNKFLTKKVLLEK